MTLTFENEQDFDLGFDPEEVAAVPTMAQLCYNEPVEFIGIKEV